MSSVGPPELLIILLICVLIFGGSKLPKLARSLGEAKTEFEKSASKPPSSGSDSEPVTMTKAELANLLDEREAAARRSDPVTMTKAELEQLLAAREAEVRARPADSQPPEGSVPGASTAGLG